MGNSGTAWYAGKRADVSRRHTGMTPCHREVQRPRPRGRLSPAGDTASAAWPRFHVRAGPTLLARAYELEIIAYD